MEKQASLKGKDTKDVRMNEWSDRVVRRHVNRLIKLLEIYLYRVYKNRLGKKEKKQKEKNVQKRQKPRDRNDDDVIVRW